MTAEEIARLLRAERENHSDYPAQVKAIDNVSKAFAAVLRVGDSHFSSVAFLIECGTTFEHPEGRIAG